MEDQAEVKKVELYIPRKCSATNNVISAKDHSSVQINVGHVDEMGLYTGDYTTVAFCGKLRSMGKSDAAMNRLMAEKSLMPDLTKMSVPEQFQKTS